MQKATNMPASLNEFRENFVVPKLPGRPDKCCTKELWTVVGPVAARAWPLSA